MTLQDHTMEKGEQEAASLATAALGDVEAPPVEGVKIPLSSGGKPVKPVGVAWYNTEADYEAVRALCGDMPEAPYQAWRAEAQDVFDHDHWGAKPRVQVPMESSKLEAWCAKNRAVPNAAARQRYVYEAVEKAFDAALKAYKAAKKPRRFLRF